MGNDDDEQAAKQNRWGTLAARLEVQCEDVLSMETEEVVSSRRRASQPLPNGDASGLSGVGPDMLSPPVLRRECSSQSAPPGGSTAPSAYNILGEGWAANRNPSGTYQNQLQPNELIQRPRPITEEVFQRPPQPYTPPNAGSENLVKSLKDWIVTKKVDKDIQEATSSVSSTSTSGGMSPYKKQHIEKCVKIAHLLVAQLDKSFEGSNKKRGTSMGGSVDGFDEGADEWDPKPQDIDEDVITVTEDPKTGAIIDVGFDLYRNFDWDQEEEIDNNTLTSPEEKLGLMFQALGKLLYKLFMEGEDVPPCPTHGDTTLLASSANGEFVTIPDEDDIMDMLRKLSKNGASGEDEQTDGITSIMRNRGHLPMPVCQLVTDLFRKPTAMNNSSGHGPQSKEEGGSCFGSLFDLHADIQQMVDFPDAFLFASITSRWELVFGNNHMFGRKKELQQLMDAAHHIQVSTGSMMPTDPSSQSYKKQAVLVSGHAGSGKSRLVREIRKPLQGQGWLFLRCKFGKTIQAEPLSVIALGLDEYFSSSVVCPAPAPGSQEAMMRPTPNGCSCANSTCPRKVCQRLESLIGHEGLKCLSQQMPSLCSLIGNTYARDSFNNFNGMQGKIHLHHLFGTLLDTLACFSPVLFFVDDLQWADNASLELLTGLINRPVTYFDGACSTNRILFVGAYRTDNMAEGQSLRNMIHEFETSDTINTTQVSLHGFQLESLNEMVSEALCLPRRKTRSLSEIIHLKTQGFPLFVVEFLDALWTEKLLVNNPANGWEWDVDAIDLKGISKSVAELLTCKLKRLPPDVLSGIQVLSCFGSHVDFDILEAVKDYDGSSDTTLLPALDTAQEEGLIEKAGPTFTFSHHLIQQAAFELIPMTNRIALLQKLVSCLIPCCMQEGGSDSFLFVTVDLINRIGSDSVSDNPVQSQLFARLNLEAGKKYMAFTDFVSAVNHFKSGTTFLGANYWEDQYELSLSLFENSALANYSEGNHEQVVIQVNHVLSNAKSFEDKFKSYCVFINVIALGSMDRATEKIYDLLKPLGENIDPSVINPQMAISELMSTRGTLSGAKKDIFMHLFHMTDRTKLMAMKLMSMLVVYYNQQKAFMGGYLVCKMIRISLQYGHCEDTVFALSLFSHTLQDRLFDIDESYAVARTALSLLKFYNADQLIPRIYGPIYGRALISQDTIQSTLDPLLKACRLAFLNGNYQHAAVNTMLYSVRSMQSGKKINLIQIELNAFAHQHKQQSHMSILQLFLAPAYKFLSALSGISMGSSELLTQLAAANNDDIIKAARAKNEMIFVQTSISMTMLEAFFLRDFAKASQLILENQDFFQMLHNKQMMISEFEIIFYTGLISFHMARETREAHWMEKAANVLAAFENWSNINQWNFESRYLILKAELHHTKGETNAAGQTYDQSIESAQKHCFIHHVALACELAAHYFGNIGAKEKTREMIQKSHDAYMEWGATRKAETVINLLELKWLE